MKYQKNSEPGKIEVRKVQFGTADPWPLLKREAEEPGFLKRLVLAVNPVMRKKFTGKKRKVIRNLLLDPAYQVK